MGRIKKKNAPIQFFVSNSISCNIDLCKKMDKLQTLANVKSLVYDKL